jgi:hypothetical protein
MRQGWIALGIVLVAVGLGGGGCDVVGRTSEACYPTFPTVTPACAPAGGVVAVTTAGWSGCRGSRTTKYGLWLGADAVQAFRHHGERLATVRVDRTGRISAPVRIPPTTPPGPRAITIGRLPNDREEDGCDDTGSCGIQPSNLTVLAPP